MMNTEASVAIYWDFENVHAAAMTIEHGRDWFDRQRNNKLDIRETKVLDIAAVMQYASTLGEVVINRAYANWTNFWPYAEALNGYSMDLVQLFPIGMNAKNGADIRLSLDIAEDLHTHGHIDIVILVSGDSDFISIAQRVRRRHKRIVGLGVEGTSNRYWQMACNEFKFYHTVVAQHGIQPEPDDDDDDDEVAYVLAEAPKKTSTRGRAASAKTKDKPAANGSPATKTEGPAPETEKEKNASAAERAKSSPEKRLLVQAVQSLEAREGKPWIMRVKIKPMMLRLDPAFDEANYDYSNFTAFLEGNQDIVELKSTETDTLVRVRTRRRGGRRGGSRKAAAAAA